MYDGTGWISPIVRALPATVNADPTSSSPDVVEVVLDVAAAIVKYAIVSPPSEEVALVVAAVSIMDDAISLSDVVAIVETVPSVVGGIVSRRVWFFVCRDGM